MTNPHSTVPRSTAQRTLRGPTTPSRTERGDWFYPGPTGGHVSTPCPSYPAVRRERADRRRREIMQVGYPLRSPDSRRGLVVRPIH
jgi:hypothetical protein